MFSKKLVINAFTKHDNLGTAAIQVIDKLAIREAGSWAFSVKPCLIEGVVAYRSTKSIVFTFMHGNNEYYANISKIQTEALLLND